MEIREDRSVQSHHFNDSLNASPPTVSKMIDAPFESDTYIAVLCSRLFGVRPATNPKAAQAPASRTTAPFSSESHTAITCKIVAIG